MSNTYSNIEVKSIADVFRNEIQLYFQNNNREELDRQELEDCFIDIINRPMCFYFYRDNVDIIESISLIFIMKNIMCAEGDIAIEPVPKNEIICSLIKPLYDSMVFDYGFCFDSDSFEKELKKFLGYHNLEEHRELHFHPIIALSSCLFDDEDIYQSVENYLEYNGDIETLTEDELKRIQENVKKNKVKLINYLKDEYEKIGQLLNLKWFSKNSGYID